ncbi:MAG: twin-arginine translocase TatA/TatE family subunit [Acidobacteriota bacterium]
MEDLRLLSQEPLRRARQPQRTTLSWLHIVGRTTPASVCSTPPFASLLPRFIPRQHHPRWRFRLYALHSTLYTLPPPLPPNPRTTYHHSEYLFGPKKLPKLARELGKWVGEFRRASNEFKMQMEEELRISEQAERQKQIEAMEAAAPPAPALNTGDEATEPDATETTTGSYTADSIDSSHLELSEATTASPENIYDAPDAPSIDPSTESAPEQLEPLMAARPVDPLPIATAGDLNMMPPATGLPISRSKTNPLGSLVESIPTKSETESTETAAHGS